MASSLALSTLFISLLILCPLLVGWWLDRRYGDPEKGFHPIVLFGKIIAWGEHRFNRGEHRTLKGGVWAVTLIIGTYLLTMLLIAMVLCVTFLVLNALETICRPLLGNFSNETVTVCFVGIEWAIAFLLFLGFKSLGVFYCLAGKTLRKEVREVFRAADCSVEAGRKQVGRIVGRDTSELSLQEVRTAALETLAENLSDGVIAPLFWFLLLGLPGMMAYKMVNTLDSMIGYQNERYKAFGCWAAKIDDVANYIPARLTAFLMAVVYSGGRPSKCLSLLKFIRKYGRQHASPNSGYPESALAGILNCRFGGPHNYFGELFWKPYIGENERPLTTADMERSIRINARVETLFVGVVTVIYLVATYFYACYPGNIWQLLFTSILR
jgi:adenosylcobinamide-phosphate synthase